MTNVAALADEPHIRNLAHLFSYQDGVVDANYQLAHASFGYVDKVLTLGWNAYLFLHGSTVLVQRQAVADLAHQSDPVIASLFLSGLASLTSSARLALFGDYLDSVALLRGAFEAAYHAEYFGYWPDEAREWERDALAPVANARVNWDRKILKRLMARDDPTQSRKQLYQEFSRYRVHSNVAAFPLRHASATPGVANLGFTSAGKRNAAEATGLRLAEVGCYLVSGLFEQYANYLNGHDRMWPGYVELAPGLEALRSMSPRVLVFDD